MKVTNDNYYVVSGWMTNELGLKGTPLLVYAIIYGFTQDGESEFTGSRQYMCDFTGATKPTIDKAINELIEKGLIDKTTTIKNGVKFNSYRVIKNFTTSKETLLPSGKETLLGGGKETLHNNKEIINNIDNIDKENTKEKAEYFQEFWNQYPRKVAKREAEKAFYKIPNLALEFSKIMKGLMEHKKCRQWQNPQYIPYPATWLHQERWKDYENGKIGGEIVDSDEWYNEYYKAEPVKHYTDEELEEWHYKEFGERVKYKNGVIQE